MSEDYAKEQLAKHLLETRNIKEFLSMPGNEAYQEKYETVANDFNFEIIAKRKDYQTFDEVINYLYRFIIGRDVILKGHKRLTRLILFYMYWNCDIGRDQDD